MIKANELRIGNMVLDDEGTIVKIESLRSKEFNDWNGAEDDEVLFSKQRELCWSSPVSGIPLTEDWLLKFGFENKGNLIYNNYDTWSKPVSREFHLTDFLFELQTSQDRCNYFYLSGVQIKHIHQLQNLYFALTGQELTLNPE